MSKLSCECEKCKSACQFRPGWFKPEQIQILADNLKLTIEELFDKYLAIDWWFGTGSEDKDIFMLAPALRVGYTGTYYDYDPRGTCIFFKDGKCSIYDKGKPFECSQYMHTDTQEQVSERHREVAMSWKEHQETIEKLFGDVLCIPEPEGFLGMF